MKIKKVHIVGIYGSGKSTLAKELSKKLKIKTYDLDEIKYKRKYDLIRPVNERLKIIRNISKRNSWITEGAWTSYAIQLYKKADIVIFLQIAEWKLYARILSRYFKRKLDEMSYENNNLLSTFNIMRKVWQYFHDKRCFINIESHKKYLRKYAKEVIIIRNSNDLSSLFKKLY